MAKKTTKKGFDNETITDPTDLTIEQMEHCLCPTNDTTDK